ncbi:MAG: L-threonylcarbamoyladenylate synthase [Lachnospiraceae bacterium]
MKTIIKKIDRYQIDMNIIREAGQILKRGGLVAFPTETVYGLGADALNKDAARKTYEAKGRPSDNPLIVHVADIQALDEIIQNPPPELHELAYRFWPGPLTIIFEKSAVVPLETTGGLNTVAVRMPEDLIAREVIIAGGGYISAPSANTSGRPSPTTAAHVMEDMEGKIDMILDGGSVEIGVESTILDMTVRPPAILRPGAVTRKMLREILPDVVSDEMRQITPEGNSPKAPGMKYRHYAPKAPLTIIEGTPEEEVKAIRQIAYEQKRYGKKVGIIATSETAGKYSVGVVKSIGARENEKAIARNLYGVLRDFDREDVDYIYSESFSRDGIGWAIMNRLGKAAGYRIVEAEEITDRQQFRRILFVSGSGNCRSLMAAELLRNCELLQEYDICSRGLVVLFPEPANAKAEEIMKQNGLSLSGYETSPLTEADIDDDTLVLTMEEGQKSKIRSEYGQAKHVLTFCEYLGEPEEILSAYGLPLEQYGKLYKRLNNMIQKLADKLNEEAQN